MSVWAWVAVALTVVKLWLTAGETLNAVGGAVQDDQLFLNLAHSLLHGQWLGTYDWMTLAKGPFYSMWVAFVFLLGLPLLQAQQLAYAGICALTVRALAPVMKGGWARLGTYTLLLWNPMSFDAGGLSRVLRQDIYPHLTLLLFAAMIALYARRGQSWCRLAPWAVTLGLTWAAFWLTREESVWIMPSLAVLGFAYVVGAWRHSRTALKNAGRVAVGATLAALVPLLAVCALNARYYGWFGTVEFRAGAFKDAYGALLRVRPKKPIPFVPVTREMRERIYAVSPAFAELKPYLEGGVGYNWARNSASVTHRNADEREIGGGWFMWALREAVHDAGHARSARDALAFYARVAREVNRACDDGTLPAGPPRRGFMPPLQKGQLAAVPGTFRSFATYFVSFVDFSALSQGSVGTRAELDYFRDMTHMHLSRPTEAVGYEYAQPDQEQWNTGKQEALNGVGNVFRRLDLVLILAAHLVFIIRGLQLAIRRRLTYSIVVAVAAWGGCASFLLICAFIQVTSFPVRSQIYFAPAYPLILLFTSVVICEAVVSWTGARAATVVSNGL